MNRAMERSAQWPSAMSANPKANAKASKKTLKKTVCSNLCRIMHTRCPGVERQLVCVLPRGLLIMIVYRSTPAYAVYAPCFAMALIPHKTTAMHFGCQNHHGRSAVDDHDMTEATSRKPFRGMSLNMGALVRPQPVLQNMSIMRMCRKMSSLQHMSVNDRCGCLKHLRSQRFKIDDWVLDG